MTQLSTLITTVTNAAPSFVQNTDSRVMSGDLSFTGAVTFGGIPTSAFVQNTDSRVMSGNVNFTGANVTFGGVPLSATYSPINVLSYSNILINSGMEVSQTFGTSSNLVTATNYHTDQWKVAKTGTMVVTAQQVTDAPPGYNNSLKFTVGTAQSSLGAGDFAMFWQPLEGFRTSKLAFGIAAAQSITLGFWTKIHRTGMYSGSVQNVAGTRSYPFTFTQNVADTWEYKSVIITGDVTGTWIGNTNAQWGNILFSIAQGTTALSTANVWAAGNFWGATGTTNGVAATSDVFQITGITMFPGSVTIPQAITPNLIRSYDEELKLCLRYLWVDSSPNWLSAEGISLGISANRLSLSYMWPVQLRAAPVVTLPTMIASNVAQPSTAVTVTATGILFFPLSTGGANSRMSAGYSSGALTVDARM